MEYVWRNEIMALRWEIIVWQRHGVRTSLDCPRLEFVGFAAEPIYLGIRKRFRGSRIVHVRCSCATFGRFDKSLLLTASFVVFFFFCTPMVKNTRKSVFRRTTREYCKLHVLWKPQSIHTTYIQYHIYLAGVSVFNISCPTENNCRAHTAEVIL